MAKRKAAPKLKGAPYSASLKIFGKVYTAKGSSVSEAISNLKPEGTARGTSVLTVQCGQQKRDRILPPNATFRLFSASKLMRDVALKNTSLLFGGMQ